MQPELTQFIRENEDRSEVLTELAKSKLNQ